jgi:hypothetical protein
MIRIRTTLLICLLMALSAMAAGYMITAHLSAHIVLMVIAAMMLAVFAIKAPLVVVCIYPLSFIDAIQNQFSVGGLTLGLLTGLILIAGWVIRWMAGHVRPNRIARLWWACLIVLPLFMAIRFAISSADMRQSLTFAAQAALVLTLATTITKPKQAVLVSASIIAITMLLAVMQLLTLFHGASLPFLVQMNEHGQFIRIAGLARDPNYGSLNMAIGFAYVLGFLMTIWVERVRKPWQTLALILTGALLVVGVVVSGSRAGMLALAIAIVPAVLIALHDRPKVLVAFGLFLAALVAVPQIIAPQITAQLIQRAALDYVMIDPSNIERLDIFRNGIDSLRFGAIWIGNGNPTATFHNTYIDLLSYAGIPALIIYLVIFIGSCVLNLRVAYRHQGKLRALGLSNSAAILVFLLMSATIGAVFEKAPWMVVGLAITTSAMGNEWQRRARYDLDDATQPQLA